MNKKIFLINLVIIILLFSGCSKQIENQPKTTPKPTSEKISSNKEKTIIDYETYTVETSTDQWYQIIKEYDFILSTSEDVKKVPYLYSKINILKTKPQLFIIPKYSQIQYNISEIKEDNGIISIYYSTISNPKIDRLIGQKTNISYEISAINLSSFKDGKYKFKLISKESSVVNLIEKDIEITIPKPIIKWDVKNINKGSSSDEMIYSANDTGNWQIYKYNFNTNQSIQLTTRHKDSKVNGMNSLGYSNNNINIPNPIYDKSQNKIYYATDADIYKVDTDGHANIPVTINLEDKVNKNGYKIFEKDPKLNTTGHKILYQEVTDPIVGDLYIANLSEMNQKKKINMPEEGYVEWFDWGKNDNQIVVSISTKKNEKINGKSNLWVLNLTTSNLDKQRKLETFGQKIHSLNISPDKTTLVFSQKLYSEDSENKYGIYSVNLNNTNLKRLTPEDNNRDIYPIFSPDGQNIAYLSSQDSNNYNLFIVNKDGEKRKQVTDLYITDKPYWLNNEEIIVIDNFSNILRVNISTGESETFVYGFDKIDKEKIIEELNESKETKVLPITKKQ